MLTKATFLGQFVDFWLIDDAISDVSYNRPLIF